MRKKVCLMLILLLLSAGFSNAESQEKPSATSTLSFSMLPGISIPIGQDKDYFKPGGDIGILLYYRFPLQPLFFLNGVTGYSLIPLSTVSSLSVLSLGIGGGVTYDVLPILNIKGWSAGGYFRGFLNDKSGPKNGNPCFSIGAGIHYFLTPPISLGLDLL